MPQAVDPRRVAEHGSEVMRLVDEIFPLVEGFYVDLHRNPELSHQEHRTARAVAEWLSRAGYEVATGVGGTGVVGVLRNGEGPTVLLRGDMDALPVEEKTGLPYASTAYGTDADGQEVPIMHAGGHDAHTACLVGAADLMAGSRDRWSGTLMIVAQPGEETLDGARGMIEDGLYERFGRPDIALAQHVGPQPAGMVVHRAGIILGAASTMKVRVFGRGGHGSQPHTGVDPVVIAATIVTRLQAIVAREINPSEMAVITVGVLRAGTKADIIPDEAYLEINTRSLNEQVSERLHSAIERVVRAEAAASGAQREPEVTVVHSTGMTRNDAEQTRALAAAHRAYFGAPYVIDMPEPSTASEDFGEFGLPGDPDPVPYVMWFVGATPHEVWAAAPGDTPFDKLTAVPGHHSSGFAPDREPTLRAGLAALTIGALSYLGRSSGPGRAVSGLAAATHQSLTGGGARADATQGADMDAFLGDEDEEESTQSADMDALLGDEDEVESTQSADMDAFLGDEDEVESTQSADMDAFLGDEDEVESTQSADMDAFLGDDEPGEPAQRAGADELLDPPPPLRGPTQGTETGPSGSLRPPAPTGPAFAAPPPSAPPPSGPPVSAPPPPPEARPYPDEPPYRF
ncbi:amidohydrolase [Actinorugispora endophytica]|uniref:Hippurate hydrolase n=1 Tax=Actinorugispora endophytica TaxID=1605990 RepID=A0A4R6UP81_9ACTN|nr:amidohydrolase [Actinorugispora endophytica]TDQ47996.1 hippurate hydrolase [Actinorugispora endophytica]